ncbi:MAG: ArsC/Spx/MgsR family protein, partial [Betaproteobacteria bacterium]
AMVTHPILVERPIIENANTAVVGRPPERVMEIL